MKAGKIAAAITGVILGLMAMGMIFGGGGLLAAGATQRDADGFFVSPTVELSTDTYAMTTTNIDLGSQPGDWFPSGSRTTVRLDVTPRGSTAVFVGIGATAEIDAFLDDVPQATVTRFGPGPREVSLDAMAGDSVPTLPTDEAFWVAATQGTDTQTLTWDLERGEWTVVVMNADAGRGVLVEMSAAAKSDLLVPAATGILIGGLLLALLAAFLLVQAFRRPAEEPAPSSGMAATTGFTRYPVRIEGELDSRLSRWQWLVKWVLAIPHYFLLIFLWLAFVVLTVVAGFAIVFTGRYPRSIFDFNVGVLRWTWRVSFYTYGVLGTDQYPPFTLDDVDYPATFDVAYPVRLSRGLVLVKWWLLAIPQYLIVGLLTSGLIWWTTQIGDSGQAILQIGGGLIGLLVLVAALALLFTGRYPRGLFDLVMGLNRWVFRVVAYAALMRDEYPPFRLDSGGTEPPATSPPPPSSPAGGGHVPENTGAGSRNG